jgi:hypothetical protein
MNPTLPLVLKMTKDVPAFVLLVLCCWEISRKPFTYFASAQEWRMAVVLPLALGLFMLFGFLLRIESSSQLVGIVKNYLLYYVLGGLIAVLARRYQLRERLEMTFIFMSSFSVLLGLYFYIWKADDINNYAFSGRMVAALANPNYLGYVCLLSAVLVQVRYLRRPSPYVLLPLGLAGIGLVTSGAFASALMYVLWLILSVFAIWGVALYAPVSRSVIGLLKILTFQAVAILLGGLIVIAMARTNPHMPRVFIDSWNKVASYTSNEAEGLNTVKTRTGDMEGLFERQNRSLATLMMGGEDVQKYKESDISIVNLMWNWGVVIAAGWVFYFLAAPIVVWRKSLNAPPSVKTELRLLSLFGGLFVMIHLPLQYLPEKYPVCLFIAWFTGSLLLRDEGYDLRATPTSSMLEA